MKPPRRGKPPPPHTPPHPRSLNAGKGSNRGGRGFDSGTSRSERPTRPFQSRGPRSFGRPSARSDRETNTPGAFIARGVRVVHEDDDVIVIDKPTGLVTADPARAANAPRDMKPSARFGQTLFDFVKRHVRQNTRASGRRREKPETGEQTDDRPGRLWIIHRLDKEASGLVVFAKSSRAYESLKEQFRTKQAHRLYFAVAEGVVGEPGSAHTHQSLIAEDRGPAGPRDRAGPNRAEKRMAITHFRVAGVGNDRTLLHVRLDTGRKNQIRVHMQELGHPLVGDPRFGAATDPLGRLGLHAAELGLTHPATKITVRYTSPVPASFFRAVDMPAPRGADNAEPYAPTPAERQHRTRSDHFAPASGDDTSWNDVAQWYDAMLDKGNDHYEEVILPATLALLNPKSGNRILDVACGQGILARRLVALGAQVTGIDAAPKLIQAAKTRSPEIDFRVADARSIGTLGLRDFDGAACVMALGNIDPIEPVLAAVSGALRPGGVFVAVISHPAFRNPSQSAWGWDFEHRRQYRRVDAYLSPSRREIAAHPGKAAAGAQTPTTPSFHRPIGYYVNALAAAGLRIDRVEELISRRAATSGPRAGEENRARNEFPLFLALRAAKP